MSIQACTFASVYSISTLSYDSQISGRAQTQHQANKSDKEGIHVLPPDIVQSTLPYLEPEDIKNLSYTNRYYHNLLDYESSMTLWHDLFHKAFVPEYTSAEPFQAENTVEFKTCAEVIMMNKYPDLDWHERYLIRENNAELYTWGCLKHARLGYTVSSNRFLEQDHLNGSLRIKIGVNAPTKMPWFDNDGSESFLADDRVVSQLTCGGFAFQVLTKSGKLFNTGSTFSGGHKGPSTPEGEADVNPFRELTRALERSHTSNMTTGGPTPINLTGTFPRRASYGGSQASYVGVPTSGPHEDIYDKLNRLENIFNQGVPGNDHVKRLFTMDSVRLSDLIDSNGNIIDIDISNEQIDCNKFVAISAGRSHILALDDKNRLYSWDSPETDVGVRINFEFLHDSNERPILKIDSGWDFNCVFIHSVGLVLWNRRDALRKGDAYAKAHYKIIPNTGIINSSNRVLDFSCTQNNTVYYITREGSCLWQYSNGLTEAINLPIEGKLSKLIACFASLIVFDNRKNCYSLKLNSGKIDITSLTKLELEDPDEYFIQLASGDYHTLGLTQKGNIYTWGIESQSCGCLGLGSQDRRNTPHNFITLQNVTVQRPAKIDLGENRTCVAVAAGGWQSGAIIINNNDSSRS